MKENHFLVLEIGSHSTKIGFTNVLDKEQVLMFSAKNSGVHKAHIDDYGALSDHLSHVFHDEDVQKGLSKPIKEMGLIFNIPISHYNDRQVISELDKIVFDRLGFNECCYAYQPLMCLFSCGVGSGLVVEIGHEVINITPIFDAVIQVHSVLSLDTGGRKIGECFRKIESHNKNNVNPEMDDMTLDEIKEKGIFTALKPESGEEILDVKIGEKTHHVGKSRFCAVEEAMFSKDYDCNNITNLPCAIMTSVEKFEIEKQRILLENILLTGYTSLTNGMETRIRNELSMYLPVSDNCGDEQIKHTKFLKIPEYFRDVKGRNELATWIGSFIVSKTSVSDHSEHKSRLDYTNTKS